MRKFIITLSLVLLASFGVAQNTELLSLNPSIGTKFTCSKSVTALPLVVKSIGDVNGDLVSDIAVGVPDHGIVAIIYGGANLPNGLDVCAFSDLSVGFRIRGPASSNFGSSIATTGDLNGDGIQDIVVADTKYAVAAQTNQGRVYAIYLPTVYNRRSEIELASLSYYSLSGTVDNQKLGTYLGDGFDYNNDGLKDVLIGSAVDTKAYIFFGRSAGSGNILSTYLNALTGITVSLPATTTDAGFGSRPVASCSDLNKDGYADFIIMGSANIFVLFGVGTQTSASAITIGSVNSLTIPLGTFAGTALTFGTTNSVTCADIDMDGNLDVILSASDKNVHVLYGNQLSTMPTSSVATKTAQLGFLISQNVPSSTFGQILKRTDGWNGYGQDVLLISDSLNSQVYALYASSGNFGRAQIENFAIDSMIIPTQGFKIYTQDRSFQIGTSLDATYDINGDGLKDLLVSEGLAYNAYAVYGQCQSATGCACPNGLKYKNGYCVNQGLSGGQKAGIIVGVIIGAMLLIALGVLILKKTSCGASCFESYAKPAQFGSHTHAPIPQTMATSA